ncbi:LysR substrate-binding domain-containing protein [Simiduia sp. 21SJ11W-1]|uniref:LysR substrate-binding domain-containing protein n=1 Tax=Simiduia sp. 21SJ11W-1 TaxID=2909669 RepID=UPI00209D2A37|nr:LysR substrate-binding domain-containing protein [Simiduia sp. 21SJ11W-1]UTA46923.1 LysR substrate-binding domain-containing protein [Simiduia sp. 21SJ11W-1]
MKGQLPSTASLQCFATSVETGNVTKAAERLCLTQSAVSRQIKQLEELLGQALFERVRQRMELTAAGQRYYSQIAPVLQLLAQATDEIRQFRPGHHIVLGIEPALASHWLLPALAGFTDEHPDISLHLMTDIHKLYQRQVACDLTILFGQGHWPGMQADFLMGDELVAVATGALLAKYGNLGTPGELVRYPLLHHTSPESSTAYWWRAAGLGTTEISRLPGQRLETFPLLLQAAQQGLGATVLPWYFVADRIAQGDLCQLGERLPCEGGYYLVADQDLPANTAAATCRAWLLGLAKAGAA